MGKEFHPGALCDIPRSKHPVIQFQPLFLKTRLVKGEKSSDPTRFLADRTQIGKLVHIDIYICVYIRICILICSLAA